MIRYAVCQYYEPFVMGGKVYQERRFAIEAEDVNLINNIKAFAFYDHIGKRWCVYELTTGAFMTEDTDKLKAIYLANKGVEETPDFEQQMKKFGDNSHFPEVPAEEALKRLNKGK